MCLQVKTAYGHLTGTGRGGQSGDALLESNGKADKEVAIYALNRAERLS